MISYFVFTIHEKKRKRKPEDPPATWVRGGYVNVSCVEGKFHVTQMRNKCIQSFCRLLFSLVRLDTICRICFCSMRNPTV